MWTLQGKIREKMLKFLAVGFAGSITLRLGKRKLSEPALKLNFSALSALITLAKYSLGGERQAPKSS